MTSLRQQLNVYEPISVQNLGQPIDEWKNAKGAHVAGYIDFTSGLLTANIGHDNPRIMEAVSKCKGWSGWYAPSKQRLNAYRTLDSILPRYLDKYLLLSTGSEAVDQAIKIATDIGYSVLTHERSYHGSTIGAQWASGISEKTHLGKAGPLSIMDDYNKVAILLETFIGPYCEWYPPSFIEKLKEKQRNGSIIIFDEMQAGFGRTGKWFGFEHYKIAPDIVVGGKAAAGGFPFAFVAGRADLMNANPGADYVSTFSGNPIGCAAFCATVREIREGKLLEQVHDNEPIIIEHANEMVKKGYIKEYMGKGFAYAFYPTMDAKKIVDCARGRGLLLIDTGRGTIKIAPPLVISKGDLVAGMKIIEDAMRRVR